MNPRSSFDIAAPFLEVAPRFRSRWEAFLEFWGDEAAMSTYSAMEELAQFLVESHQAGKTEFFPEVFCVIEQYLETGDEELENLVQVGLFETLQNIASHRAFGFTVFEEWLGPLATPLWEQADKAMTTVNALAAASRNPPWWQFWKRRRRFDSEKALRELRDPKLREIIEAEYRRRD